MKRIVALVIAWNWLGGLALFAQGSRHSLRLNGWGAFGFGYTNSGSVDGRVFTSNSRDFSSEVGLDAQGFLYDPRLLLYTFSTFWDGNNNSLDLGSARSRGLSFNGGLSFLPERSFPFTFYFSRGHSTSSGSLIPPYTTITSLWGLRGELRKPRLAWITYNVALGKTENDLATGEEFNTKQRSASLSATRKLSAWDLRFDEEYLRSASTFSDYLQSNNTVRFGAARSYAERIRVDLGASYSNFGFRSLKGGNSLETAVTLAYGNLAWKHTAKLDSFYDFSVSRNAVNSLRILTTTRGEPSISLPFNPRAVHATSESFVSGVNYRVTPNLSLNANLGYAHNDLPKADLASLPPSVRNSVTTSVLNMGAGYSYRRKVWKLELHNASLVSTQRFGLATGGTDSGIGFSLENGVAGGDPRRARFSASYRYSRRSNPIFFNVVTGSDHRANLKVETTRWRVVTLEAIAEIGRTQLDLASSRLRLDLRNYMLSATLFRLSMYASHDTSNSGEHFFGPGSILLQPGGSTGGVTIPGELLTPLIFSDVTNDRVGVNWRPRTDLQVEGRYWRSRFLFATLDQVENRFQQVDISVQYKYGRFTIVAGYGRANAEALHFNRHLNRVFFRVWFPFHIL